MHRRKARGVLSLIASFDAPSVQIPVFCQASPLGSPGKNSKILGDPSGLAWQRTDIWTDGASKLAIKKSASLAPLGYL